MADEAEVAEQKGPNVVVVVLLTVILTLLLSVGGLYFAGMLSTGEQASQPEQATAEKSSPEMNKPEAPDRAIVEMFSGMITLKDNKHLSFRLVAEVGKEEKEVVEKHMEALQNMIILYTSDLSSQSFEGRRGKMKALDEIKLRVNSILRERKLKIKVNDLYLTKFELP